MGKIKILIIVLLTNYMYAQNTLEGIIQNKTRDTLTDVSVFLLRNDSIIEKNIAKEGYFKLKKVKIGDVINFSHLDYLNKIITIEKTDNLFLHIELEENYFKELIYLEDVKISNKIKIKKDTVTYKAHQFLNGSESNTEDLLNKIPGVSVDNNGKIKILGKDIERIMVNGDDLLRGNYKALSRGLDPKVIEDVEIHYNDEENELLKGTNIEKKYAINLKIKEEYKNIIFGDADLGYNLDKNYRASSSILNLRNKNKIYVSSYVNNIGEDQSLNTYRGNLNEIIKTDIASYIINEPMNITEKISFIDKEKFNFNNNKIYALNDLYKLSDQTNIKLNIQLLYDKIIFNKTSNQTYFDDNKTINFEDMYTSNSKIFNNTSSLELNSFINKKIKVQSFLGLSYGFREDYTNQLYNGELLTQSLNSKSTHIQQKNIITLKAKNNNVVNILSTHYNYERLPQDYELYKDDQISQRLTIRKINYMVDFQKRIKSENILYHLSLGFSNDIYSTNFEREEDNLFKDINAKRKLGLFNMHLKNHFLYTYKNIKIASSVNLYSSNYSGNYSRYKLYIDPNLSMKYEIKSTNFFELRFSSKIQNLDFNNLLNFKRYSSINTISEGDNEIGLFRNTNINFNYNFGNFNKLTTYNLGTNYSFLDGNYTSKISFSSDFIFNKQFVLNKTTESLSFFGFIDYYIRPIKSSLRFKNTFSTGEGYFYSNQDLMKFNNTKYEFELKLSSGFNGFFNYTLNNKLDINKIKSIYNSKNHTINTKLDLFLNFNFLKFNTSINRFQTSMHSKEVYFFDMNLVYKMNSNLEIGLRGRNLFNEKTYDITNFDMNNEMKTTYNMNPKYILLNINYKIK